MLHVLMVLPGVPTPPRSGGALRTLQLVRAADAAHRVTVLVPAREGPALDALRAAIRGRVVAAPPGAGAAWCAGVAGGMPAGYPRYSGPPLRAALAELLSARRWDLVHLDHLHTAPLLGTVRRLRPSTATLLDEHNVESALVRRVAETTPGRLARRVHAWNAARVERLEGLLVSAADVVLACSERDAAALAALGAARTVVVPNGFEPARRLLPPAERRDLVFVGAMDWEPNVRAAVELATRVWPRIAGALPHGRLAIVGRDPCRRVRRLARRDVVVTGTVEDVAPYLATAFATAMPLRAGGGTRLKILEAAAAGVPVVGTALAAEGLPLEPGREFLRAETADEFVRELRRLADDPALQARIARAAAAAAEPLAWSRIGARLLAAYDEVVERRARERGRVVHLPSATGAAAPSTVVA